MLLSLRLAFADLVHARLETLCRIAGLAATVLPLMILLGVKNGVLADRTDALLTNPEALRIGIAQTGSYPRGLIDDLRTNPDVRFVVPHPVQMALIADMAQAGNGSAVADRITLLSTGAGDPYLGTAAPPKDGEVVLSSALSGTLSAQVGARVDLLLPPRSGSADAGYMPLVVTGVLPVGIWGRQGALLSQNDLFLVSDWSDGRVSGENLDDLRPGLSDRPYYPGLRLYAADIPSAFRLVEKLNAQGIATSGALEQARQLMALSKALETGFTVIAAVALVGAGAAFSAGLWSSVLRNRRSISLLRLNGFSRRQALGMVCFQALLIGGAGWVAAVAGYAGLKNVLDVVLADVFGATTSITTLGAVELGLAAGGVGIIALVAAMTAGIVVTSINPAEGIQDA